MVVISNDLHELRTCADRSAGLKSGLLNRMGILNVGGRRPLKDIPALDPCRPVPAEVCMAISNEESWVGSRQSVPFQAVRPVGLL